MVCGRSRYLDGSEAKVKEVTLEHLTLYGLPSLLCSEMTSEETQHADRRRLSKGVSAVPTIREYPN
jgi:hypothetical protein